MKKLLVLFCVGSMLVVSSAVIAGPQQERMRSCNKDAKEKLLKGEERKAFMKNCLRKKTGASSDAAEQARREKSAACNNDATGKALKGSERKQFMRDCMKG